MPKDLTLDELMDLQSRAQSVEELDAIKELGMEILDRRLADAVGDFKKGAIPFLDVGLSILQRIDRLKSRAGILETPGLEALYRRFAELQRELHRNEAMGRTDDHDPTPVVKSDEEELPPPAEPVPLSPTPRVEAPLHTPQPIDSRKFEELADEYTTFFLRAGIRPERESLVRRFAQSAMGFQSRYEAVGRGLGIPWWFIAGIHLLESTFNFDTHLHNGDPLSDRTRRVPKGRPVAGGPPFRWEESAADALTLRKLEGLSDWSLPRALWRWEGYNGFGYRSKGVATPYLWSFSTIYGRGKFVRDGVFDASAVSQQCGAAVLLKALHEAGAVDLKLDVLSEDETRHRDADGDAQRVVAGNLPNIDDHVPDQHPFEGFFAQHLGDIRHFKWHEFLVKGAAHASNGLNTDPPRELWPNVIPLARLLDAFREAVGRRVVLTSVYRSPAYNRAIGGAIRSQHVTFCAADFKVPDSGDPGSWAAQLRSMRAQGLFEGGIGTYNTFVHVDTRGSRADWDSRT